MTNICSHGIPYHQACVPCGRGGLSYAPMPNSSGQMVLRPGVARRQEQ